MAARPTAFIIDDEEDLCLTLCSMIERLGWSASYALSLGTGLYQVRKHLFDLVLTDLRLPDGSGMQIVEELTQRNRPVAVLTAYGDIPTAVAAMKLGALDFLVKPINREQLQRLLQGAATYIASEKACRRSDKSGDGPPLELIGSSPVMQKLRAQIARYAKSLAPVLIVGPSGSGKELAARLIHAQSPRAHAPWIAVNCAALPVELAEAELFGAKKGAFTGAYQDRPGLIAAAHGGTLFLDEVGELPLSLQPKLLRVLQEQRLRMLGSVEDQAIDIRLIAATHVDLQKAIAERRFREDLYYRLAVLTLEMPSLAERREDIPELAAALLARLARREGLAHPPSLSADALCWLTEQHWNGNVRELENVLARALVLSEGVIDAKLLKELTATSEPAEAKKATHDRITPAQLEAALEAHQGNQSRAAQQLGITLSQLRYRMRKWGIAWDRD